MDALESVLGYKFRDRQLLIMALTHGSVGYEAQRNQPDNQRLEFLGDAVLQLMLSDLLYQRLPDSDEGKLTKLRSQIVSTKALAVVARRLNLGKHLIMGRGEQANGGRDRENILADAVEALVGAAYQDGGLEKTKIIGNRLFKEDIERLLLLPDDQNPKGQLQEMTQALSPHSPEYTILNQSGPDHAKIFEANVTWLGTVLGTGSGNSKKEAETEAARVALKKPDLMDELKSLVILNFKATKISTINCEQAADNSTQLCEQSS